MKLLTTLACLIFSITSLQCLAQKGRLTGKVVDGKSGQILAGATVTLEPGNKSTTTDLNGVYAFNNLAFGNYSVTAGYVSFSSKTESIVLNSKDAVAIQNILLQPASAQLSSIMVKAAKLNRESASALLVLQKNRSSISDGISFEVIRRTPDKSASDVLKRITGASIQEDKFAVIRGLNDRYNYGMLNGSPLPSSESDRKAFAFDVFSANLLDNIVIAKTATPDLPAEFAGGIIMVNTKSIPDQNFQSLSVGVGYNSLTTSKDKIGYKGSNWNYLEYGNTDDFDGNLPTKATFPTLFSQQELLAKKFKNNWALTNGKYSPNYNAQYTIGHNIQDDGKDYVGILLSLTYSRTNSLFEINRKLFENSSTDSTAPSILTADFTNTIYSTQTLAGALGNFSVKIDNNNILSFKNLYNITSDERLVMRQGQRDINPLEPESTVRLKQNARVFTGNKFFTTQFEGQHYIPGAKMKMVWSFFYNDISRTNPSRNDTYTFDPYDSIYKAQVGDNANDNDVGTMKTIKTSETLEGGQFDVTKSIGIGKNFRTDFKAGILYQERMRLFNSQRIGFAQSSTFDYAIANQSIDSLFDSTNLGSGGFKVVNRTAPFDRYDGNTKTLAYYAMLDQRFKFLRLIYGVRFERFKMVLNSVKNDYVTQLNYSTEVNSALPSANLVVSVSSKQNVRLCYSQTVNRPEFREIAPFLFYDYSTGFTVTGNDTLQPARIHNYDVRYEFYPGRSQVFSVTGFYKKFEKPIETVYQLNAVNPNISYQNSPDATNIGVETEIRIVLGALVKKQSWILNNLTVLANYAYIKSKVVIPYSADLKVERRLQGQSSFVVNSGIIYNDEKHGFGFSGFLNRTGPRIFYGGNNYFPDVWENGKTVVDLQLSKSFFKQRLELRATAKDLLAQKQYFFEDKNNNQKLDMDTDNLVQTTTFGKQFTVSASFRF